MRIKNVVEFMSHPLCQCDIIVKKDYIYCNYCNYILLSIKQCLSFNTLIISQAQARVIIKVKGEMKG